MDGQPPFGHGSLPRSSLPPKPGMPGSPVQQSTPGQPHTFQGLPNPRSDGVRPGYGRHPGMGRPPATPPTGGPMAPPAGNWPQRPPNAPWVHGGGSPQTWPGQGTGNGYPWNPNWRSDRMEQWLANHPDWADSEWAQRAPSFLRGLFGVGQGT